MAVSRNDLVRLARLARLRPDTEALEALAAELAGILEHVRTMEEVADQEEDREKPPSGAALEPLDLSRTPPEPDPLRRPLPEIAPAWEEGFFVVPRLRALDREGDGEGEI